LFNSPPSGEHTLSASSCECCRETLGTQFLDDNRAELASIEALVGEECAAGLIEQLRVTEMAAATLAGLVGKYGKATSIIVSSVWNSLLEQELNPRKREQLLAFEEAYHSHLLRIAPALLDYRLGAQHPLDEDLLPRFQADPERVASLTESYGLGGAALMCCYGDGAAARADQFHAFYRELYLISPLHAYHNFLNIGFVCSEGPQVAVPDELFEARHDMYLKLARLCEGDLSDVPTCLSLDDLRHNQQAILRIGRVSRRQSGEVVRAFKGDLNALTDDDLPKLLRLLDHLRVGDSLVWGAQLLFTEGAGKRVLDAEPMVKNLCDRFDLHLTGALIEGVGLNIIHLRDEHLKELEEIEKILCSNDRAAMVAETYASICWEILETQRGFYPKVVERAGGAVSPVCTALRMQPWLALRRPQLVCDLTARSPFFAGQTLASMDGALWALDPDLVLAVQSGAPRNVGQVLKHFTGMELGRPRLRCNRERLIAHASKYGPVFEALVERFNGRYYHEEERWREVIADYQQRTGKGADQFFRYVPVELWEDLRMQEAASFYREAAGLEFQKRGKHFFAGETDELRELREECFRVFHIRHAHRFTVVQPDGTCDCSLLEANLERLKALSTQLDVRLFVHLLGRNDHNGSLGNSIAASESLQGPFVVIYVESGGVFETLHLLRWLACLRGVDVHGNPLFPIAHCTLSIHANHLGMFPGFGRPESELSRVEPVDSWTDGLEKRRRSYHSLFDLHFLREVGRCIAYGGTCGLDGCEAALGGAGANNFLTASKKAAPHVTFFGVREIFAGIRGYTLSEASTVEQCLFNVHAERMVRL